ncbi:pentapeptide repeat-containing protein [Legionella sp. WA2024007413]
MNDKHELNQQEQIAMIRAERARQFAEQKAKEEAKGLLAHLNLFNEFFHHYSFPTNKNEDIYATTQSTDKYVTAVLELQPVLNELIQEWDGIESDLRLLSHAMQLLASGKSSGLGASFEHELTQFFKGLPMLKEHLNEVTAHINDRDEERRYHDQSIIVDVNMLQEHLQHILLQLSGEPLHDVDELTVSVVSTAPSTSLEAAEGVDDINQGNAFFALPDEIMMYILLQLSPQDLLNARGVAKSKTGVVDATFELITRPHFIIDYLSHADGMVGHQFTAFYQRTQRYQELKRKVLANEPLTAEEAICYTLTRDCNVLPANLKEAMQKLSLDETTRNHLELISTASEEIRAIDAKINELQFNNLVTIRSIMEQAYSNLLATLKHLHPLQFVNLIAGSNFSGGQFSGQDFSYLNLRGIQFRDADLRGANFNRACLAGADLSRALLKGVHFTDEQLRDMQLNGANFAGVDLSANNLEGIDFEWAYVCGAKLLPVDALNSAEELSATLAQFAQSIAKHSSGSKRKLQECILAEIAQQLEISTKHSLREKMDLLDVALAAIKPAELIVGLFPFQNACQNLKEKMSLAQPTQNTPEHPLKKEAKDILDRIWGMLHGTDKAEEKKPSWFPIRKEINIYAYKQECRSLIECISKYPELNDGLKVTKALGISPEMWHMLYTTYPAFFNWHPSYSPILVDYPRETQQTDDETRHYASEVFNGHKFNIGLLQKVKWTELDQYLYEEEDFVILEGNEFEEKKVKLGDLLITFCPYAKGSDFPKFEVIDYERRQLQLAFSINLAHYGNIPFETFLPFDLFDIDALAGITNFGLTVDDIQYLPEVYALKKQIIERVFASERVNRNRKKELFFPIFEQHEDKNENQLAVLPTELLDMVCAYVHKNQFRSHKNTTSLVQVGELHGQFFRERAKSLEEQTANRHAGSSSMEKGNKINAMENQQPKSAAKLAAPRAQGLFTETQNGLNQDSTGPVAPSRASEQRISAALEQNDQKVSPSSSTKAASHTGEKVSKNTVPNLGLRMFPEQRRVETVQDRTQGDSDPCFPKPIAIDVLSNGSCLIS